MGMKTVVATDEALLELLVLSDPQITAWLDVDLNELRAPRLPYEEAPAISARTVPASM
jgi:hypothetical protein